MMRRAAVILAGLLLLPGFLFGLPKFADAACSSPSGNAGNLMYNSDSHLLQFCDGTSWISTGKNNGSGSGCYAGPTSGIAGWWKLDDGSGSTATDSSGGSHHGSLVSSPVWTTGKVSGGLAFNGYTSSKYVSVPDSASLQLGSWTVSAWVKFNSLPGSNDYSTVIEKSNGPAGDYSLGYQNGFALGGQGLYVSYAGTGGTAMIQGGTVSLSTWYLVTGTYDASSKMEYLYINGVLSTSANQGTNSPDTSGGNVYMGCNQYDSRCLDGTIDDVRVYNRALSAAEIYQIYVGSANAGILLYNNDYHVLQYCNGVNWVGLSRPPGAGPNITDGMNATNVLGQGDLVTANAATTRSGMWNPPAVVYDPTHSRLFVADDTNSRVLEYDLNGGISNGMNATHVLGHADFTTPGTGLSQSAMYNPLGLAYDPVSDRLFVADGGNRRVLEFDLSGGITDGMNASHVLGQPDFTHSTLNYPNGTSTPTRTGLSGPAGLAYDSVNQRLFVADDTNSRVLEYDLNGGISNGMNATHVLGQSNFTSRGLNLNASGMYVPHGLAYDSVSSRLFVVDNSFNRVTVYSVSGSITDGMSASYVLGASNFTTNNGGTSQSQLMSPQEATYDSTNNRLFVADMNNFRVLEWDLGGTITNGMNATHVLGQANFTSTTRNYPNGNLTPSAQGMSYPEGVAYDAAHDRLFVADNSNSRVTVFNFWCANPSAMEGSMLYDSDHHIPEYCDGTNWIGMSAPH